MEKDAANFCWLIRSGDTGKRGFFDGERGDFVEESWCFDGDSIVYGSRR